MRRPLLRQLAVGSAALIAAMVALALYTPTREGVSAGVVLRPLGAGEAQATLTLHPPDAAAEAEWFDLTAWQGGALVVALLRELSPGRYRTTEPVPVDGTRRPRGETPPRVCTYPSCGRARADSGIGGARCGAGRAPARHRFAAPAA